MAGTGRSQRFSRRERSYLASLPAVERVTEGRIYYNDAFKQECVRRYRAGESATHIFDEAGMPSQLIGQKRIERSIARWNKSVPGGEDRGRISPRHATAVAEPTLTDMAACIQRIEERLACIESRLDRLGGEGAEPYGLDTTTRGTITAAQPVPSER